MSNNDVSIAAALRRLGTKLNGKEPSGYGIAEVIDSIAEDYQGGEPTPPAPTGDTVRIVNNSGYTVSVRYYDKDGDVEIESIANGDYYDLEPETGDDAKSYRFYVGNEVSGVYQGTYRSNTYGEGEGACLYSDGYVCNPKVQDEKDWDFKDGNSGTLTISAGGGGGGTHTITYSSSGSDSGFAPSPLIVNDGETAYLESSPSLYKDNYNFAGWAYDPYQSSGGFYEINNVTSDVTVYPVFEEAQPSSSPTLYIDTTALPATDSVSVQEYLSMMGIWNNIGAPISGGSTEEIILTSGNRYRIKLDIADFGGAQFNGTYGGLTYVAEPLTKNLGDGSVDVLSNPSSSASTEYDGLIDGDEGYVTFSAGGGGGGSLNGTFTITNNTSEVLTVDHLEDGVAVTDLTVNGNDSGSMPTGDPSISYRVYFATDPTGGDSSLTVSGSFTATSTYQGQGQYSAASCSVDTSTSPYTVSDPNLMSTWTFDTDEGGSLTVDVSGGGGCTAGTIEVVNESTKGYDVTIKEGKSTVILTVAGNTSDSFTFTAGTSYNVVTIMTVGSFTGVYKGVSYNNQALTYTGDHFESPASVQNSEPNWTFNANDYGTITIS